MLYKDASFHPDEEFVLAERNFGQFAGRIRANLADGYKGRLGRLIDNIRAQYGEDKADVVLEKVLKVYKFVGSVVSVW